MRKKTSYKSNSWWNHRMVGSQSPDRDIRTAEDRRQDKILEKLEQKAKKNANPKIV
jgi:hypothetical protein